jgi:hypothetical protein
MTQRTLNKAIEKAPATIAKMSRGQLAKRQPHAASQLPATHGRRAEVSE